MNYLLLILWAHIQIDTSRYVALNEIDNINETAQVVCNDIIHRKTFSRNVNCSLVTIYRLIVGSDNIPFFFCVQKTPSFGDSLQVEIIN